MKDIKSGLYKHFKGYNYFVISTAIDSENEAPFVLYSPENEKKLWIRPLEMFSSEVETPDGKKPRFEYLRELKENEKQSLKQLILT